jgi:hypothetical protein
MPSRSLRALLRLAALWAVPWALVGVALAVVAWRTQPVATPPLVPLPLTIWLAMFVPAITALGLISGLSAGLLLAWAERGRAVATLSPRRAMAWGAIGGALPLLVLGAYGLVTGLPTANLASIALAGTLTALGSGGLTGWLITTAQRRALPTPRDASPLRLTGIALLIGGLVALTAPERARAQTPIAIPPMVPRRTGAGRLGCRLDLG